MMHVCTICLELHCNQNEKDCKNNSHCQHEFAFCVCFLIAFLSFLGISEDIRRYYYNIIRTLTLRWKDENMLQTRKEEKKADCFVDGKPIEP